MKKNKKWCFKIWERASPLTTGQNRDISALCVQAAVSPWPKHVYQGDTLLGIRYTFLQFGSA